MNDQYRMRVVLPPADAASVRARNEFFARFESSTAPDHSVRGVDELPIAIGRVQGPSVRELVPRRAELLLLPVVDGVSNDASPLLCTSAAPDCRGHIEDCGFFPHEGLSMEPEFSETPKNWPLVCAVSSIRQFAEEWGMTGYDLSELFNDSLSATAQRFADRPDAPEWVAKWLATATPVEG